MPLGPAGRIEAGELQAQANQGLIRSVEERPAIGDRLELDGLDRPGGAARRRAGYTLVTTHGALVKILRLADARVLLWARERRARGGEPFEVSKVVSGPIQGLCPTAPRCPAELASVGPFGRVPSWIDPHEPPRGACAYGFGSRGECLRHRNQSALESALFSPDEARRAVRLLEAMGFSVEEEAIDPGHARGRILLAHGGIGPAHQVRLLSAPGLGSLVLVREVEAAAQRRPKQQRRRRLRVLPVGGQS